MHGQRYGDVLRAGACEIELRRWPRQLDGALEAKSARHATFSVELPAGKTTLRAILERPDGNTRGACFVYVTRR